MNDQTELKGDVSVVTDPQADAKAGLSREERAAEEAYEKANPVPGATPVPAELADTPLTDETGAPVEIDYEEETRILMQQVKFLEERLAKTEAICKELCDRFGVRM